MYLIQYQVKILIRKKHHILLNFSLSSVMPVLLKGYIRTGEVRNCEYFADT